MEKIKKGESQKRKNAGARKGMKIAKHYVSQMFCGSGGLATAAGAEPAGQMKDEKWRPVLARSTFGSKKCQSMPCSEHCWKLRCRKSGRSCGAKPNW